MAIANALTAIQNCIRRSDWSIAESLCREQLAGNLRGSKSDEAKLLFYLSICLLARGAAHEAVPLLQRSVLIDAEQAHVWSMLGTAQRDSGQLEGAEASARTAIGLDHSKAIYWTNLGHVLYHLGRWNEAIEACGCAIQRDAQDAVAWENLAASHVMRGALDDARDAYERGLKLAPSHAGLAIGLANLQCRLGRPDLARGMLLAVLLREGSNYKAWIELGHAWQMLNDWHQAQNAYQCALARAPNEPAAYRGLIQTLLRRWQLREAEAVAREFVETLPDSADAWGMLGAVLQKAGRQDEACAAADREYLLEPTAVRASGGLLLMQYSGCSPLELLHAHRAWDARFAAQAAAPRPLRPRVSRQGKLKVGFVSADFGRHPAAYLALPALEHLNKDECSIVCYFDGQGEDEFTRRFRRAATLWRPIDGAADERVLEQVRADGIDVLIDLMGHTGTRMPLFAGRAAPTQITWMGYVGTTGVAAIDYLLADRFHVQPGEEAHYSETVLRLPNGYVCYGPPRDAPPVAPLPALETGQVTFGCFNNPAKLSTKIVQAWAVILSRVPTSRLLLKFGGLDDPGVRTRLLRIVADRGVDSTRLICEGWSPHAELLEAYGRVDLALDTQPYSGGLTTCEALWMGVPVITCPGATFAGRHSISHLNNAGFPEFVASNLAQYTELAIAWSQRIPELAAVRSTMRSRMQASPLCDAPRFATDLLALLKQVAHPR